MKRRLAIAVTLASLPSARASAFVQASAGDLELELRGNFRWNLTGTAPLSDDLPDADVFHTTFVRLIGEAYAGSAVSAAIHALQVVAEVPQAPLNASTFNLARTGERNRTAALRWTQAEEGFSAFLELDQLQVGFSLPPVDLRVGRQPINLSTASLFTPNDFFAPFAAQAFFRQYKPGVDAARLHVELGPLSYVSAYGVLGYAHGDRPRAADPVDLAESSLLGRAVTVLGTFEISALGGVVADRAVFGGGLQGELFDWLGIRAEGHGKLAIGSQERDPEGLYLAVGVEHRFESSLFVQLEYYHNGAGALDASDYVEDLEQGRIGDLPYLGRHLGAAAASYEITPLLTGFVQGLVNFVDGSVLLSAYATYSLLDEAELAVSAAIPIGAGPTALSLEDLNLGDLDLDDVPIPGSELPVFPFVDIPSEFGLYPFSASVELRAYF